MRTLAFFNNRSGVGQTTLVYHLAHMYAELGVPTLAVDLDPQANLTLMFLQDERLEALCGTDPPIVTMYGALKPLLDGKGDLLRPELEPITSRLGLLVGDVSLSLAESELNTQWPRCLERKEQAFRVTSAFWRIIRGAAKASEARLVLIDVGPNLGAINRAALLAAQHVAVPLAPDLYSLQGLRNLGSTLRLWHEEWADRRELNPLADLPLPQGEMAAAGYVVMQHAVRRNRSVGANGPWMNRIPAAYREALLGSDGGATQPERVEADPNCLALLRNYRSLMPMAQEAGKPMFFLKPADGALGSHGAAVQDCYQDFRHLALRLAERCGVTVERL